MAQPTSFLICVPGSQFIHYERNSEPEALALFSELYHRLPNGTPS
jgi:hypothetical protein